MVSLTSRSAASYAKPVSKSSTAKVVAATEVAAVVVAVGVGVGEGRGRRSKDWENVTFASIRGIKATTATNPTLVYIT